jgi:alkylation response protein AidB-like acyl-CoA dehydrogenase
MHFEESDEEKMFRDSVHEFAQRCVARGGKTYDEKTHEVHRNLVVERRTTPISS